MPNNKFYLERDLLKSTVFRSLCKNAILVYFDFRMKCKWQQRDKKGRRGRDSWFIINNGEIEFTYSEAEKKGISRASFMRALDELTAKGFVDIEHSGAGGVKGDKSLYAISERWRNWGTDKFVKKARPRDTRSGRGFAAYWKRVKARRGITSDNTAIISNDNSPVSRDRMNFRNDNPHEERGDPTNRYSQLKQISAQKVMDYQKQ